MILILSFRSSKTSYEILNLLYTVEEVQANMPDSYTSAFVLSKLLENILPTESQWKKLKENLILVSYNVIHSSFMFVLIINL